MPEQDEYDEDEFDTDSNESALVKDLRKQLRAANKKSSDLEQKLGDVGKGLRERTVKDVLTAKGVRQGIAKYVPSDITDEAGVTAWLEENAEDFGITLDGQGGGEDPDPELEEGRKAQSLVQRSVEPNTIKDFQRRIEQASDEEFDDILREAVKAGLSWQG